MNILMIEERGIHLRENKEKEAFKGKKETRTATVMKDQNPNRRHRSEETAASVENYPDTNCQGRQIGKT